MLIKPKSWERYGLKPWIEAAIYFHQRAVAIGVLRRRPRSSVRSTGAGAIVAPIAIHNMISTENFSSPRSNGQNWR